MNRIRRMKVDANQDAMKKGNIMSRTVGFLNSPGWAGLILTFSVAWLLAALYVCGINYLSTYYGIVAFFPDMDVLVICAFVVFIQGSEFIIPVIEEAGLHREMPKGWKDVLRITWILVIVIDYLTAVVWFNGKAGITLGNFGAMISQETVKTVGIEIGSLVFSIIFLVAEILVVLGMRSVAESYRKLSEKLRSEKYHTTRNNPLPQGFSRNEHGRPFREAGEES